MSDKLVLYTNQAGALSLRKADPAQEEKDREKRINDALDLEAKLKKINDTIPTRIYNTSSSSAGAGSGDFHQYRMMRKTEQLRVKRIEEDWKKSEQAKEFEERKRDREMQAEEQTAKRRAKRLKKKSKQNEKKNKDAADGVTNKGDADESSSEEEDNKQPELD